MDMHQQSELPSPLAAGTAVTVSLLSTAHRSHTLVPPPPRRRPHECLPGPSPRPPRAAPGTRSPPTDRRTRLRESGHGGWWTRRHLRSTRTLPRGSRIASLTPAAASGAPTPSVPPARRGTPRLSRAPPLSSDSGSPAPPLRPRRRRGLRYWGCRCPSQHTPPFPFVNPCGGRRQRGRLRLVASSHAAALLMESAPLRLGLTS